MLLVVTSKVITLTFLFSFGRDQAFANHLLFVSAGLLPLYCGNLLGIHQLYQKTVKRDSHHNAHKAVDEIQASRWTATDLPVALVFVVSFCGKIPHHADQKTQFGYNWTPQLGYMMVYKMIKAHTNLVSVFSIIPHPQVSPSGTVFGMSTPILRSDKTSPPNLPLCKEAFLCVRMEFFLTHVHPAGCTSSDNVYAQILHKEGGQWHQINGGLQM